MEYTKGISFPGKGEISSILISTAFGTDGGGIFPYTLWPSYRRLLKTVKEVNATVLTKSITFNPRAGNFIPKSPKTWRFIQRFGKCSMLNAYGLTNKGVVSSIPEIIETVYKKGINVIPNLYPELANGGSIKDILDSIHLLISKGVPLWAVELNFSCLNSKEKISENMGMALQCAVAVKKEFPGLIVIAKTSIVHPFSFYRQLEDAGVDVIHGINTIPYELVYPSRTSPLADVGGGGVSGEAALLPALEYLARLRETTSLSIIMGCGGASPEAIKKMFSLGANAVSICTLALMNPELARTILLEYHNQN